MRRWRDWVSGCAGATLAVLAAAACASAADRVAVEVTNASTPTLCAETDNVYLKLTSAAVRRFTIEAEHPAYAGTIVADRMAPDFRNCDMSADPVHRAEPRRVTIYETADTQLIGCTFPSFWRPKPSRSGSARAERPPPAAAVREIPRPDFNTFPVRRLLRSAQRIDLT
jgi:hypothetical protein